MICGSPYKCAWSIDESVAYIDAQLGAHFDPELVAAFYSGPENYSNIRLVV
jgi:response regulator RpfG family c-di-GMP phosphodiesterase